jgi:Ca2+-transporting ATPase
MLRSIIPQSLYQIACQLIVFFVAPQLTDISDKQLSGFMFNMFIFTQIFNLVNVSSVTSVFPLAYMRKMRIVDICVLLMAGVQVIIMFLLSDVFKIEKITGDMWAISTCLGFGSCIVHAIVTAAWVWIKE